MLRKPNFQTHDGQINFRRFYYFGVLLTQGDDDEKLPCWYDAVQKGGRFGEFEAIAADDKDIEELFDASIGMVSADIMEVMSETGQALAKDSNTL